MIFSRPSDVELSACLLQLKGADRKHKQDRDKIMKRPDSERDKYQPSYECTVLSDVSSLHPMTMTIIFIDIFIDNSTWRQ